MIPHMYKVLSAVGSRREDVFWYSFIKKRKLSFAFCYLLWYFGNNLITDFCASCIKGKQKGATDDLLALSGLQSF